MPKMCFNSFNKAFVLLISDKRDVKLSPRSQSQVQGHGSRFRNQGGSDLALKTRGSNL